MLSAALQTIGLSPPEQARLIWVPDTLHLAEVECSQAYFDEADSRDDLEILGKPRRLPIDEAGDLPSLTSRGD